MFSPLTNFGVSMACGGKSWFGWPCDEESEKLQGAYLRAPDEASRRVALETDRLEAGLAEVGLQHQGVVTGAEDDAVVAG